MYKITHSGRYKREYRLAVKRGNDMQLLEDTIDMLAEGKPLPPEYRDHPLKGNYKGYRECHVGGEFDWLLIYKIDKGILTLLLSRTGTHQDLFND